MGQMKHRIRKLSLTSHIASSLGWLGAALAYIALAITAITTDEVEVVRSAYPGMEIIGWYVIVPLCLAALVTGVLHALGTEWGLFRHYWIAVKLLLVVLASVVLLAHMPAVSRMAEAATELVEVGGDLGAPRMMFVVHAVGGVVVLVGVTVISMFKPWGRTAYGRRVSSAERRV